MKRLLKNSSNQEPGTLQQLKNLLNRHLPNDPKGDMNGYEDFLFIIGIGHMMSAAMELLGMTCAEDVPKHFIPSDTSSMNMDDKKKTLPPSLLPLLIASLTFTFLKRSLAHNLSPLSVIK